jgi:phosphate starvation-inducible protein PhoH
MSKRKNKRHTNTNDQQYNMKSHFELREIKPLTPNQERAFSSYKQGYNLILHGYAGTGKSFISLYLALNEVLSGASPYDKIIIVRSVVPSRDIGFLPGGIKEKIRVYEDPYKEIVDDLFGRGDGYDILKLKNIIQFTTTSFLRGMTFNNAIVIIDELQNFEYHEGYTTLTRLGENTRFILCGDSRQTDLKRNNEGDSFLHILNILKDINTIQSISFQKDDIVRGGFIKDFIIKSEEYMEKLNKARRDG